MLKVGDKVQIRKDFNFGFDFVFGVNREMVGLAGTTQIIKELNEEET